MRTHGRLLVSIWRDKDFIVRSVEAQRCYMMLLAQKDVNNAGVQPLMIRKWARGCEATSEDDIVRALNELQGARFVCYDVETEELLIRSFIRNDGIVKQPNVLKNALRVAEQTESPRLRQALSDELENLGRKDASEVASRMVVEGIGNPFENPSETLPEPLNPSGTPREPCGDGDGEGVSKSLTTKPRSEKSKRSTNAAETPEQSVTDEAYNELGKAFNFIAVRQIVKWAIHDRGTEPESVKAAVVGIHRSGRPITKQTVDQWLNGQSTREIHKRDPKSGLLVER